VHKFVLPPKEEGKIEIIVDTRRFNGPKTKSHWLTTQKNGGPTEEFILSIQADSNEDLKLEQGQGL
jgi:hypothetical protein